jgi:hypothetical protein
MSALDVLRACAVAWNDHQADVIAALYDAGARRVSPLGALEGRDAIRSFVLGFFVRSPDTAIKLGRTAENHDDVLFEFVHRGTHQGPLRTPAGEIAGTGRIFTLKGTGVISVVDDRIANECLYFDPVDLTRQLTE